MSTPSPTPHTDEVERLVAAEAVYRLTAVLFGYPLAETQQALESGRLREALTPAWQTLTGESWPELPASPDLAALELGYMSTFVQGQRGKPRVPLVASAYSGLLGGQTPGSFLLNVQAFYRHFDLQAARGDEGHADEPDHLVAMLEFCALLCHLEHQALLAGRDPAPYQRAQRDFIARYVRPLLAAIQERFNAERIDALDPTLAQLIAVLPGWVNDRQAALASRVGPCPPPRGAEERSELDAGPMWG
ncbi:molecular chaperone TorD family protein [Halomonas halodenitrificans]|uniref:molecular chaperone TorD family protein n=1 Tax=Halomonas halodenitrificans TaxID=28252 RepID=UPI0006840F42|nr:molecular chaperone TorD family protein [Halomonas halodenitrificans]